jgi:hypothetical protein
MSKSFVRKSSDLVNTTRAAGNELREAIETLRISIIDLKDERVQIENSIPSKEIAEARFLSWIDAMVAYKDTPRINVFTQGVHYRQPYADPMLEPLVVYLSSAVKREGITQINEFYSDKKGLSNEERDDRLATLDRQILDAELAEETIIRNAEAIGLPVARRADANPLAVLADASALP